MKLLRMAIISLITVCISNGADLNIKSSSELFNKHLTEIKEIRSNIENSGGGRAGAELNKYFHWNTLPNAFSEIIVVDDAEGFKGMLEVLNRLNIDINSFGDENNIYNIAIEMIDNNSLNCMKLLVDTEFDLRKPVLDKNYNDTTLLRYAKSNGASKEMIDLLEERK